MADVVSPDQRQQDVVILLALVLVHRGDFVREANQGIVGTSEKLNKVMKKSSGL